MSDNDENPVVIVERGGLGSFFFGLAIGAGLALLLAPQSGEVTRKELKERSKRIRSVAGETFDEMQESVGGKYEETRAHIEDGIETAKRTVKDTKEAGTAALHSARDELERRLSRARAERQSEAAAETAEE